MRTIVSMAPAIFLLLVAATSASAGGAPAQAIDSTTSEQLAQLKAQCIARAQTPPASGPVRTLYERLGGEERIHVITREMVRLRLQNPTVAGIVRKYDPDYLADILARYLITARGGPTRCEGPPLATTHAHLRMPNEQFLAGGADFSQAMKNIGMQEAETIDTVCLLGSLKDQIVNDSQVAPP